MPAASPSRRSNNRKSSSQGRNPKWKLMVYFASDNPLSPLIVSQLKAIKDAGFQTNTDVLVYFDPMETGVATKLYDVNHRRKANVKTSKIGDGADPFVRNMIEDEIDQSMIRRAIERRLAGTGRKEPTALESLSAFIDFGLTVRPAESYILILVGHGMIVGNDAFLPDEDPVSAITLKQLRQVTAKFGENDITKLRLLALHSCSMSSIELAYELQGTADYLIATQGTAFVNSWPYRQLLKKTFNMVDKAGTGKVDVQALVEKLYFLTLFNATDFMSAGYSADLALINLKKERVGRIKGVLSNLVQKLKAGLNDRATKDLILLAHLESQSFFEENYTDLFDFCSCLRDHCFEAIAELQDSGKPLINKIEKQPGRKTRHRESKPVENLGDLASACTNVMKTLAIVQSKKRSERFTGLVVHEDNFGWKYQFSTGLSIYFPWTEPLADKPTQAKAKRLEIDKENPDRVRSEVLLKYNDYAFTKEFKSGSTDNSWFSFLLRYFDDTMRPRITMGRNLAHSDHHNRLFLTAKSSFDPFGVLSNKVTPEVGTRTPEQGISCTCPSIKNYQIEFRRNVKKFFITPGTLRAFQSSLKDDPIRGNR